MRAWVLEGINDLRLEDVPEPVLKSPEDDNKVILKVKAAGICGSDIQRVFKTGAYHHPLIPGHEFSGEVVETGKNVTNAFKGMRAGVFPLIPCMECDQCRIKMYQRCAKYDYLGSRSDGGFAEYVKVPEVNLIPIPDNVSYEAAAMLEPLSVAVHAIKKGMPLNTGKREATVIGLGTIGLFISVFLSHNGYIVKGLGNREDRRKLFTGLGFPEEDYSPVDSVEKTDSPLIFECVGKPEAYEKAVKIAPPGGSIISVGNPLSDMTLKKEVYWKILRSELTIRGTWNSSFTRDKDDDWHFVLNALSGEWIDPEKMISHVLPFEGLMEGLEIMRDKKEPYTKILITEA